MLLSVLSQCVEITCRSSETETKLWRLEFNCKSYVNYFLKTAKKEHTREEKIDGHWPEIQ